MGQRDAPHSHSVKHKRSTGGARGSRNVPEFSQNRRGNGYPVVSDRYRDIVSDKPKRIAWDIEDHGFSDLQGGGRGFEPLSAHQQRQHSPGM